MANPIIQNYLNDSSIDSVKRKKVFDDLEAGNVDEGHLQKLILEKYGSKHVQQIYTNAQEGKPSVNPEAAAAQYNQRAGDQIKSNVSNALQQTAGHPAPKPPQDNSGVSSAIGGLLGGAALGGQDKSTPVGNFIQEKALPLAGQATTEAIAKPIFGKEGTDMLTGVVGKQNTQDVGSGIIKSYPSTAAGLLQLGVGQDLLKKGLGENAYNKLPTTQVAESVRAATEPKNQAESIGKTIGEMSQFALPAGAEVKAVKELHGAIDLLKVAPEVKSILKTLASGVPSAATTGIISAGQQGEFNQTAATNTVLAGALPAAFTGLKEIGTGIKNAFGSEAPAIMNEIGSGAFSPNTERLLRKSGMSDIDINALKNLSPEEAPILEETFKAAEAKRLNPWKAPSVWDKTSKEIKAFRDNTKGQLQVIGKAMDDAINTDLKGKEVDAQPVIDAFNQTLDRLNIGVGSKGALDFEKSDIALNPTAKKAIQTVWDNIVGNRTVGGDLNQALAGSKIDARGLVSINRILNEAAGVSKAGGFKADSLSAALSPVKEAVEKVASEASSTYATSKSEYAALKNALDVIDNAGKYGSGKNVGFSGKQIMTRSMNQSSEKYQKAIDAMKFIEDNYGISAPKNIPVKAQLANLAERLSSTQPSRSFAKQVSENASTQATQATAKTLKSALRRGTEKVPIIGDVAAEVGSKADQWLTDVNYKTFNGKIPGFQDAAAKANPSHIDTILGLVKSGEFNALPASSKAKILKSVASSLPDNILLKIAKTVIPITRKQPPQQ